MISFQWRNQLCFRHCMGFYHFYVAAWPLSGQTSVNALRRAYIISTSRCTTATKAVSGVNALWRAYIISTYQHELYVLQFIVSMPSGGLISFLPYPTIKRTPSTSSGCQCPLAGLYHFYPTPSKTLYLCGFPASVLQVIIRII